MSITTTSQPKYDLEERTLNFAKSVRDFVKALVRNQSNNIYSVQLLRSSSSVGANYIEANDAIGKKDFVMKIKICRREARESAFWLRLMEGENTLFQEEQKRLLDESMQFVRIFSAIIQKAISKEE
jgi:four helix bundle protein